MAGSLAGAMFALFRQSCGVCYSRVREEGNAGSQASWSIRGPCPGGSGGITAGGAALASSLPPPACTSGVAGAVVTTGVGIGAGGATLEMFMATVLAW
jgi:hypothetical protein